MSKVLVLTDTVSGLSKEMAAKYGIGIIPAANIIFQGKSYPDGTGISPQEAYRYLQMDPDKFSTVTLNPSYLIEVLRETIGGHDKVVFLTIPAKLSAANKIASMTAEQLMQENPGLELRVVDSKTVASGQGLLAIAAARAAEQGLDIDQVIEYIHQTRPKIGALMLLDTLKYVYRTGRYSKTVAMIATLLQIKPVNRVNADGSMDVVDKVRKRQDGYQRLIDLIRKETATNDLHFLVAHSDAPEIAEEFINILKTRFNCLSVLTTQFSPIMGYAAGPRCLFIGFHPELGLPVKPA